MRTSFTPTASESAKVSESPLEAAPITPEVTMPKAQEPLGPVEERAMPEEKGLEMEVSKEVVSQPEAVGVQENPYPENPDIGGQGG